MGILIVAATELEIKPLINYVNNLQENHEVEILITGVGMVATAYSLTKKLAQKKYDLAVNAGIAGTFNPGTPLGMVVNVTEDSVPGFGLEIENGFKSVFDLGFYHPEVHPFSGGKLKLKYEVPETLVNLNLLNELPVVSGMTSNAITGSVKSAAKMRDISKADIESMEGAAFFYVCLLEEIPCVQIRAISNFVGERDKSRWNIPLAVENLNHEIIRIFIEKNH